MILAEFLSLFLVALLISMSATALAVASVFQILKSQKRISLSLTLVNRFAAVFFILLTSIILERQEILVVFFFISFFSGLSSLSRFLKVYDESFRMLFLSFGYTRREYHWHYLFMKAKWVIVMEAIFLSTAVSTVVPILEWARADEAWLPVAVWLMSLFAVLGLLCGVNESIRKPGSTQE